MNFFSLYDSLIDSIFVIDEEKKIVYANDSAISLVSLSARRITQNKYFYDILSFDNLDLFCMKDGKLGRNAKTSYLEVSFEVSKSDLKGKLQVCIEPFNAPGNNCWIVICRDVTVEAKLQNRNLKHLQELENYSKNLEKMVEEKVQLLKSTNLLMQAMMDSLGQGFVTIDETGCCGDVYTKSCVDILEKDPKGKHIVELLNIKKEKREEIDLWVKTIFMEALPFESLKELGPNNYEHSKGRQINIEFYPIRNEENKISKLVMVATDRTVVYKAQQEMEKEKNFSEMIIKLVKNKEQFAQFLGVLEPKINALVKFANSSAEQFNVGEVLRFLHTMEGEAGIFSLEVIREHARRCQDVLEPLKNGWVEEYSSIRGEFSVEVAQLSHAFESFMRKNNKTFRALGVFGQRKIEIEESVLESFYEQLVQAHTPENILRRYKNEFINHPIKYYLVHYEDLIKTVAVKQNKEIPNIEFVGCDIKIDGKLFKDLFETLVHAFRNVIDHGIETAQERISVGKSPQGNISIEASIFNMGKEYLQLTIRDDGRGITAESIKRTLKNKGMLDVTGNMSSYDVYQQVFLPGFSSRSSVGEYSGRGMGLDAVKKEVEKLNGEVTFKSIPGNGSTLTILLPFNMKENVIHAA